MGERDRPESVPSDNGAELTSRPMLAGCHFLVNQYMLFSVDCCCLRIVVCIVDMGY